MHAPLVVLIAIGFLLMGLAALAAPERILATFGVAVTTADGRNEVRAVYGGFGLAMAAMLAVALGAPRFAPGILACLAAALGGMAGGRLVSAALDRAAGRAPVFFGAIEAVSAWALWSAIV
jgi:hypothetical protein